VGIGPGVPPARRKRLAMIMSRMGEVPRIEIRGKDSSESAETGEKGLISVFYFRALWSVSLKDERKRVNPRMSRGKGKDLISLLGLSREGSEGRGIICLPSKMDVESMR